jgi:hypothetical protein
VVLRPYAWVQVHNSHHGRHCKSLHGQVYRKGK